MIEAIFTHPWTWIMPLCIAGCLAVFFLGMMYDGFIAFVGVIGTVVFSGIYFGVMLPPYDQSYYHVYRISGEVTELESAFEGDSGTMSQVFIARVDYIPLYIKSDDQRFRTIEVGEDVRLVCDKRFAYFQEPWYDCSFAG